MSALTALEAAREAAQQKLDSALDSMPPRARPYTEIDVQVPIGALRELIAATTPPADDVREALIAQLRRPVWDAPGYATEAQAPMVADAVLAAFDVRPRGTVTDAEVQWEYGIRASGDAEPYSDVSEDVDWLTDGWVSDGEDHIVRRRKAGPWEVQT